MLSALSVTTIAFSLFAFGLFGLVALNLHAALAQVEERVEIRGFVAEGTNPEATAAAVGDIGSFPEVATVQLVSEVQALERARRELGEFEDVFEGQALVVQDTLAMPAGVNPTRVEFGLRTSVIWMYGEPVVPSMGQHVILGAGASDGLVPGDQVTLQVDMGTDAQGQPRPPLDVAVVQVTRVTTWGASAILIQQNDGVVAPGTVGRVTAKMP